MCKFLLLMSACSLFFISLAYGDKSMLDEQFEYAIRDNGGRFVLDGSLNDYVSRVGESVAQATDKEQRYTFVVLNSPEPQTWSLPGGKVALTRGLFSLIDNEAELAVVLAHELQHAQSIYDVSSSDRLFAHHGFILKMADGANYSSLNSGSIYFKRS